MQRYSPLKVWFLIVFTALGSIVAFNLFINPLWCFSHSHPLNNHQPGFNERQQKTNRAYFQGLENYDTLLLGSSRTAYIDQYDFEGMRVFNYAADNMGPSEYEGWIDVATTIKGAPFKTIIIGLDFFGSSKNYDTFLDDYYHHKRPNDYLSKTSEPLYRYKRLLSLALLKQSWTCVWHTIHPTVSDYDRRNVRHCNVVVDPKTKSARIRRNLDEYTYYLVKQYRYRETWQASLRHLLNKYPKTTFIFFTTPVSKIFFERFILEANHRKDYERWLRDTIDVVGKIYHFMDINSVTADMDNFFDAHHVYAPIDRMIAKKISGSDDLSIPADFGKILTRRNIDRYFEKRIFMKSD